MAAIDIDRFRASVEGEIRGGPVVDDVDCTARRVASIESALRTLQYVDAIDVVEVARDTERPRLIVAVDVDGDGPLERAGHARMHRYRGP